MDKELILSDTERELYEFIKNKGKTTREEIIGQLSNRHIGALGKLKPLGLIEFKAEYITVEYHGQAWKKRIDYIIFKKVIE